MNCRIDGTVAQSATLTLVRDETAWASKGSIIAYGAGLQWDVKVPGGLAGALKRSLSGEGIALAYIRATADSPSVTLGANAPGHIHEWDLETNGAVLTTRGAFLAAWGADINITVAIARRPGTALFGGVGLVLQRIEGHGTVLVHGRGDFRRVELAAGERLRVSTGNLAAFSAAIDYNIESVGSLRKTLFSKEGLFMTRLTRPRTVLLQTLKPRSAGGAGRDLTYRTMQGVDSRPAPEFLATMWHDSRRTQPVQGKTGDPSRTVSVPEVPADRRLQYSVDAARKAGPAAAGRRRDRPG